MRRPAKRAASRTVSWSSKLLFNRILDRELGVPSVPSVFALLCGARMAISFLISLQGMKSKVWTRSTF